jgi:hypothetical protein
MSYKYKPQKIVRNLTETMVRVKLVWDDVTDITSFRVEVESIVKPGRWSYLDIPVNQDQLEHHIEAAGAVLAERLNGQHGDTLDPSLIAKTAKEAFSAARETFEKEFHNMKKVAGNNRMDQRFSEGKGSWID